MLSELARLLKITIVGGSIPERSGDRVYNTCCVFGTDGKLLAKHRKVVFVVCLSWKSKCRRIFCCSSVCINNSLAKCQV